LESVTKLPALAAFTTMSVSCVFMAHDPSQIKKWEAEASRCCRL
jgi:hypothetical protein